MLLGGVVLSSAASPLLAQTDESSPITPSAYWQYDAPGPLGMVAVADVDNNGVDDFVAVTEGYQAVLLDATGRAQWSYQTLRQDPILHLATVNVDGAQDPLLEILLATEDELILLAHDGQLTWRKPLDLPPIPTVMLTGASSDALQRSMNNQPVNLSGLDRDGDGNEELLVLLHSGLVQLYDAQGDLLWKYPESPPISDEPIPLLTSGDLDRNGTPEIVLSYYIRYSRLVVLDSDGHPRWERALSGRITALNLVAWDDHSPLDIAIGKDL